MFMPRKELPFTRITYFLPLPLSLLLKILFGVIIIY